MVSLATGTGPRRVLPAMWAKRTAKDTRCGRRATQAAGIDEAVAEGGAPLASPSISSFRQHGGLGGVRVGPEGEDHHLAQLPRRHPHVGCREVCHAASGRYACARGAPGDAWPSMRRRRRLRAACLRPAAALCPFFSAHGRPMPSRSLSGQLGSCAGRAGPPLGVRRTAFFLPATSPGVMAARRAALPGPGHLSVPLLRHAVQLSMRSRAVRAMRVSLSPGLHCGRVSTLCQR